MLESHVLAETEWISHEDDELPAGTFVEDVKDWSIIDVERWWQTKGPTACSYIGIVRRRGLNGERLLSMKKSDFEQYGMESWLARSFHQWIRELRYDSADLASVEEIKEIICTYTRVGPEVSQLISQFVRTDPHGWDVHELADYMKSRGLKRTAKRILKKKTNFQNIETLVEDPQLCDKGRIELAVLFPDIKFYSRRNPHPESWYAILKTSFARWVVCIIAFIIIPIIFIVRGATHGLHLYTTIGSLVLIFMLILIMFCFFYSPLWETPAWVTPKK